MARERWIASVMLILAVMVSTAPAAPQDRLRPDPGELRLHPGALAELIDEVGGRTLSLPRARVIAVVNPRAFLVESPSTLPAIGRLQRVVVLVERGALSVDTPALVGATVRIHGVARTVLGVQTTREVPWPPELSRNVVQRYGIRAAILAASVQTADGVELTVPAP